MCLSVSLYVTGMNPAKTAKPIEMPFGLWVWVGSSNHVLDGSPEPRRGRGNFWGGKIWACPQSIPINMPFGMWARVDKINHVLDGGPDPPRKMGILVVGKHGHARARPRSVYNKVWI